MDTPRYRTGAMHLAARSDRYTRRMKEGGAEESRKIVHRADAARSSDASKKAGAPTTTTPRTRARIIAGSMALKHLPFGARFDTSFDTNPSQQRETSRNIPSSDSACLRGSCNNHKQRKTNRPRLKIMVSPVRIRVPPLLKVLQKTRKGETPKMCCPPSLTDPVATPAGFRLSWCDRTIYRRVFGRSKHRRRPMADPLRTTPPSGPAV